MRDDHGFGGRRREPSGNGYEVEHGVAAQQGIDSREFHFAHHGHTLGRVLEDEYFDVRVVQNVSLTKSIFDGRPALAQR